jgi:hypothetical protein
MIGTGTLAAYRFVGGPPGYSAGLQVAPTVAQASLGVNDYVRISTPIEGYRIARLAWGTVNAVPVTVGFWMRSTLPGTYRALAYNGGAVVVTPWITFTIAASNTFQWVTITLPAQTTGTWATDNTLGMLFLIEVASQATPNLMASTSNFASITGVVVLPGIEAPSAARSPLIMRPYDQELLTCMRYLYRRNYTSNNIWIATLQAVTTNSNAGPLFDFPVQMRAVPTFTASAASTFGLAVAAGGMNALTGGTVTPTLDNAYATSMSTGVGGYVAGNAVLFGTLAAGFHQFDARL